MTNEMHNSYNQYLFHSFVSALHVSNESSRSSSGACHNILYYTEQSVQSCLQHDCTDCSVCVCVCVMQYIMPCS